MKITVIIDGQEKEIELSDEQIIAIGQKYFELVSPKIELKPIDEAFYTPIEKDTYTLANTDSVTIIGWDRLKTKEEQENE